MEKKVIAITGATGLIGNALVNRLVKKNYRLLLFVRDKQKTLNLFGDFEQSLDIIECDLQDFDELEDQLKKIDSELYINGLVHLGVMREAQKELRNYRDFFAMSAMRNANINFILWDFFSEHMAKKGGGSMVFMSSVYGSRAPDFSIYNDTDMGTEPDYPFIKAGGVALSKYYASLYGKFGVRSNAIILGGVENNQPQNFIDRYSDRTCLKRLARPDEATGLCEFLLSDDSSYITGAEIPVDGGLLSL